MIINILKIENGKLPTYETIGSAGADCFARIENTVTVPAGKIVTIPLGFAVEIPEGYEMQIRGRSGLARKNGIQVFNAPGTIDSDYRGEVGAIIHNATDSDYVVKPFDRIAQAIIAPVIQANWNEVKELSETERGTGGFGSTGVSENKIEKFYEPFKTFEEVKKTLGKTVVVDSEYECVVYAIRIDDKKILMDFKSSSGKIFEMLLTQAFQRVKIDNHRFGKEIKCENN